MQDFLVALIVLACTLYAVWTLMPSSVRRPLAMRLVRWPWPQTLARHLQRAALAKTGCGCDGCDAKPATQRIQIHRRPRI